MAFNFNKLLVALFFTAVTSASIAHGIIINGTDLDIVEVQATGLLTCAIPGSGNPIIATVALTCGNASFTPTNTSATGVIVLAYNAVNGILFNSSSCTATMTVINVLSCTLNYPPIFTVPAILQFTDIAATATGQVLEFAVNFLLPIFSK